MRVQESNLALQAQISSRQASASSSLRAVTSQSSPVAGSKPISRQLDKFVSGLQQTNKISPQTKKNLIDIAALTDALINNPSARNSIFKDLAGAAVYIGKNSTMTFPNYPTLTGLRYYDSLRTEALSGPSVDTADLYSQLESVVQESVGVNMGDIAKLIENNPEVARQVMEMVGMETVVDDFGSTAPAAETSSSEQSQPAAPTPTNIEV